MTKPDIDVLIVGAGLSGIGAAVHLTEKCPNRTYAIHEGRDAIGGTWDLFRYPGIRSDSDMHTLGYNFKPWTEAKAIADGPNIRRYVRETAEEHKIIDKISFETKVKSAAWDSSTDTWTVVSEGPDGPFTTTSRFLFMCGGYYNYDQGYTPDFEGRDDFKGDIIHPQHWPEDYDYTGKRVTVIGSGATAVTLVPAMTDKAAHVTMLQRTPTYVVSRPAQDKLANLTRTIMPESWAYGVTRWRNVVMQRFFYNRARTKPEKTKEQMLGLARKEIGDEMVDKHFTPTYNPWDQRVCLIPDSDMFNALNDGSASVVTEHIDRFVENGILLKNGEVLESDIIVTATGLSLLFMNGIDVSVDGAPVHPNNTLNYKGVMLSNVPNLAITFGYTNASWTLKADITSEYVCRLLNHMEAGGHTHAVPHLSAMPNDTLPFVDFSSGYFQRVMDQFPRQHSELPWTLSMNYLEDRKTLRKAPLDDGVMKFGVTEAAAPALQAAE